MKQPWIQLMVPIPGVSCKIKFVVHVYHLVYAMYTHGHTLTKLQKDIRFVTVSSVGFI